jgi:ribosome-binding protein aMBF1 (putative translation factor)
MRMSQVDQRRFGRRVSIMRGTAGLTQQQLADMTGESVNNVVSCEKGEMVARGAVLNRLAKAIATESEFLIEVLRR